MRRIDIKIPIYDWKITIVTLYNKDCKYALKKVIDEFSLPCEEELMEALDRGSYDGGKTFSRKTKREGVVILFPWSSELSFIRILNHEKRHVIDDIAEWHNLTCPESTAYLDGFVSEEIFKRLDELK